MYKMTHCNNHHHFLNYSHGWLGTASYECFLFDQIHRNEYLTLMIPGPQFFVFDDDPKWVNKTVICETVAAVAVDEKTCLRIASAGELLRLTKIAQNITSKLRYQYVTTQMLCNKFPLCGVKVVYLGAEKRFLAAFHCCYAHYTSENSLL